MTPPSTTIAPEDLVAQVEPILREYASQAEEARQLPPQVVAALREARLFDLWVPSAYGGLELDPLPAMQVFEELGRIDGSTAWVVSNCAFIAYLCQILP
ncbi:MAG: acyl-CoA dehydrogenase family protein, partial [Dehalococcoidia bacterium]